MSYKVKRFSFLGFKIGRNTEVNSPKDITSKINRFDVNKFNHSLNNTWISIEELGGDEPVPASVFVEVSERNDKSNPCSCIILRSRSSNPILFMAVTDLILDGIMEIVRKNKIQYYIDKAPGMMNYVYLSINDYRLISYIIALKSMIEMLLPGVEGLVKTRVFIDNKADF